MWSDRLGINMTVGTHHETVHIMGQRRNFDDDENRDHPPQYDWGGSE